MTNKSHGVSAEDVRQFCDRFFANPTNAFIMDMLAVHDGDMTLKEALAKQKVKSVNGSES